MNSQCARPVEILLIEDSAADARLTREALKDLKIRSHLHVATDGVEGTAFLKREGRYADAPRPDLIVLDLNLPRKDGREVLAEIKADADLKKIPVIILTTSEAERDILTVYNLHANCYICKPVDLDHFLGVIAQVTGYWVDLVRLPTFVAPAC